MASTNYLAEMVARHKAGQHIGIYSVCSAHPLVLEAAMAQALADESPLLIEATSNQVDQFGGYTGMRPEDFREFTFQIARKINFPVDRIIFGGDHLGPNRWQSKSADEAMQLADELVAAYVRAGYQKIHLDCSMSCAGDPTPLDDATVAARATRLMKVAEETAATMSDAPELFYVIGTEVPVPGGAHEEIEGLRPTSPDAARATIKAHKDAFTQGGLDHVWPRVMALVVQPAVEFDHLKVVDYDATKTTELSEVIADEPTLLFEAHSTDYQLPDAFRQLVEQHWAVLKVGPGLTFAMREALFAVEFIEQELIESEKRSHLRATVEEQMLADSGYWKNYYIDGDQKLARAFSYSDRLRYYWPNSAISQSVDRLFANLDGVEIPLPVISQYLPKQYDRVRAGQVRNRARDLVIDRVRDELRPYSRGCGYPGA